MQAMAPGSSSDLHAGHLVGACGGGVGSLLGAVVGGGGVEAALTAGRTLEEDGADGAGGAVGLAAVLAAPLVAVTASRAGAAAPTVNGF